MSSAPLWLYCANFTHKGIYFGGLMDIKIPICYCLIAGEIRQALFPLFDLSEWIFFGLMDSQLLSAIA